MTSITFSHAPPLTELQPQPRVLSENAWRQAWQKKCCAPRRVAEFSSHKNPAEDARGHTGFSTSDLACPVRIRHLFRWFSRATLGAMPLWLLTYTFTCSQPECGYHNALDAVVQADTPKTAASQVGKSQHLCGRCGRPLTDSSSLKMAVPVPISSVEKKRPVSESGKQPSQNRGSR